MRPCDILALVVRLLGRSACPLLSTDFVSPCVCRRILDDYRSEKPSDVDRSAFAANPPFDNGTCQSCVRGYAHVPRLQAGTLVTFVVLRRHSALGILCPGSMAFVGHSMPWAECSVGVVFQGVLFTGWVLLSAHSPHHTHPVPISSCLVSHTGRLRLGVLQSGIRSASSVGCSETSEQAPCGSL